MFDGDNQFAPLIQKGLTGDGMALLTLCQDGNLSELGVQDQRVLSYHKTEKSPLFSVFVSHFRRSCAVFYAIFYKRGNRYNLN